MPDLKMHQLRVAAVAKQIIESIDIKVDSNKLLTACLLHDMGNIIKSDFNPPLFPMTDEEIIFWTEIKQSFIKKYGTDTHTATTSIAKELKIDNDIIDLIEHNDFKYICEIAELESLEKKILKYSDLRVGLYGVLSLNERINDIINRYSGLLTGDRQDCAENIEKEIFSHSNIKPEDINDESISKIIEELKQFEI